MWFVLPDTEWRNSPRCRIFEKRFKLPWRQQTGSNPDRKLSDCYRDTNSPDVRGQIFHIKWLRDCGVSERSWSLGFVLAWAAGEEAAGGITGWLTVLNLFRAGQRRAERCERTEMYPLSKNGTPGGRKWAGGLWSWTLVSALGQFHRSIRLKTAGNGARGPQRACKPRLSIMSEEERGVSRLSNTIAPFSITDISSRLAAS